MIGRRTLLASSIALAWRSAPARHPRQRAILSRQADQDDRAVPAGRPDRHHGAADRPVDVGKPRPAGHRREPPRRGLHHRLQGRGRGRPRRLHAAVRLVRLARRRARALSEPRRRSAQAFRHGRHHVAPAAHHGGRPGRAGEDGRGIRRLRQSQSRQAQLRRGPRHAAASALDAVQDPGRARHHLHSRTRARRRR